MNNFELLTQCFAVIGAAVIVVTVILICMSEYDAFERRVARRQDNKLVQENKRLRAHIHELRSNLPADVDVPWILRGED